MTNNTDFIASWRQVERIGATEAGGVERQAGTEEDRQLRDWFRGFANQRGWRTVVDGIGNLYALVDFTPGVPYILVGSHLDSQPRGGRFDGAYGVIAGLHAAERLQDHFAERGRAPRYNLAVVDWFNEEGGRFAPSLMGSSVYAGLKDRAEMLDRADLAGVTVRDALTAIGYLGTDEPPQAAGYVEIHIEQGRILEREGIPLGAVDSSWYTQKLDIEVLGEQSHTGATLMEDRRDALYAACYVIIAFNEITREYPPQSLVSSVGQIVVEPNSPIVVNRRVHLVGDLRANDPAIVRDARDRLVARCAEIADAHDVEIIAKDFDIRPNLYFPQEGVKLQEKVATDLGVAIRPMQTMAGHDSIAMNTVAPTVMMFVPSIDGVSHCEREKTLDQDMLTGLDALTGVLERMLDGALEGVEPAERY
jgi:beta-ureidopropionase / N-carbamoyl-L-amino-acid hydrolase